MKIKGTPMEIRNLVLTDLKGAESQCAETQQPFAAGDNLLVICPANFVNGEVKLSEVLYTIKESAVEDFVARMIKNSMGASVVPETLKSDTSAEKPGPSVIVEATNVESAKV
jgi:hypothetical protein